MIDGTTHSTAAILAYIPSPPEGVWNLGPFPIRAYALCIIAGIIVAVFWGNRRWKARGGQEGEVLDVAIWAVPFGLIGGRLYHVATDWQTYFGDGPKEPIDALKIWDGGLGIWGAVAFGALGAWIGARRHGIKLPPFGDALAPAILLAQAIGRLGNYFNQELYGAETTLPWGLEIYERVDSSGFADPGLIAGTSNGVVVAVVHPTFLYEMLWNIFVVIVLVLVDRYFRIGHGRLFALYVAGYCVGRFGIELMRTDPATHIFGTRINVFTAVLVFACAAAYFVLAPRGREQGLSIYHPERAAELEALGAIGYVDDREDGPDHDVEAEAQAAGRTSSAAEAALAAAIARHTPRDAQGEPLESSSSSDAWVLESDTPDADGTPDDADGTPDDADGTPDDADGTPDDDADGTPDDDADGTPDDDADGTPDDDADGTPDDDADGTPDDDADGTPDDDADGTPDDADGTPDDADGTPDDADGTPDDADGTLDDADSTPDDTDRT
ncbi:prolipoprotein diacylglyceryl transferase [Gordonia sp. PKS22-38]|uniref:Phosphatidylglycerol--prolipoprotein diacylglyceryl transferase n=1 Tax=Gordonia prachuapensis TaxID=3115651 RepID=A0ABU7MS79_9ACTN|nr:prolipoprotein diacylglyceryl transferase [Gordonia sp. PKS22-38]